MAGKLGAISNKPQPMEASLIVMDSHVWYTLRQSNVITGHPLYMELLMGQSFINGGFFSLPCSLPCWIIGVPQITGEITGETQTEVDTRSNVDLMEALPGGLRAAVDVSWHQPSLKPSPTAVTSSSSPAEALKEADPSVMVQSLGRKLQKALNVQQFLWCNCGLKTPLLLQGFPTRLDLSAVCIFLTRRCGLLLHWLNQSCNDQTCLSLFVWNWEAMGHFHKWLGSRWSC